MYSGKRHTSCSPALRIASSTSSSTCMVRASAKAPMFGLSSWYRMSRLQKARTAKAGNSITATRPAITRAQRVNIAPQAWRASVLREPVELVAEARQKRADREYSGVHLPHFQSVRLSAPRAIRSRRAIREEFLEKKRRSRSDTYVPVRTQGTWLLRHPGLFSVKIPGTDSPAFPMWGSRRALPVCEDASVAQNNGISQDGMTCTVIPTVLRACCTVVAHDCADWERSSNQRIILHAPA